MKGIERIAKERQRQIDEEGWTPEHDDDHTEHELAFAAACYAAGFHLVGVFVDDIGAPRAESIWPWDESWDKRPKILNEDNEPIRLLHPEETARDERIRALEKAGALIAAEIDRLLRIPRPMHRLDEDEEN